MTGPLTWKNGTALPEKTDASYFLAIDSFSNGGKTYWVSSANVLTSIDAAPAVDGGYLPLSGGTMTGNITFAATTFSSNPTDSTGLTWSGGTDAAKIFYR